MTRIAIIGLTALALGCSSHAPPLLICHNASCVDGAIADQDDMLGPLRDSLALRTRDGRIVVDGVEIDATWDRALGRCTFTHAPDPTAPDLTAAGQLIIAHLLASAPGAAAHDDIFFLKTELKVDVGGGAVHTPAEVAAHVACVTGVAQQVIAAGATSGNSVLPIFDSDDPNLLAAIDPTQLAADGFTPPCLFETDWNATQPPGFHAELLTLGWASDPHDLAWYPDERGLEDLPRGGIFIWDRDPGPADLESILAHHPAYIGVNNAIAARAAIDAE